MFGSPGFLTGRTHPQVDSDRPPVGHISSIFSRIAEVMAPHPEEEAVQFLHRAMETATRCYVSDHDLGTMSLPTGTRLAPDSLTCAEANGSPMMVMATTRANTRWTTASPQPARTNQTTVPSGLSGPASDETTSHGRTATVCRTRYEVQQMTKANR